MFNLTQPYTNSSGEKYSLSPRVLAIGQSVLQIPILKCLKPYLRKAVSVTEIPRSITLRTTPAAARRTRCGEITVLSSNMWHDWPRFRRLPERLEAFADLAEKEQYDILLLQEVARIRDLHAGEWLADRLGMSIVYSRANGHSSLGFEEGLALLSRFPLSNPHIRRLGNSRYPFIHRLALGATVNTPCGKLSAFSVHLGILKQDNADQHDHLHRLIHESTHDHPIIIGGDFNAHETSRQIERSQAAWIDTYRRIHPRGEAATHHFRWPWGGTVRRKRLDYIFLHNHFARWEVVGSQHVVTSGVAHSDHLAVMTRLKIASS